MDNAKIIIDRLLLEDDEEDFDFEEIQTTPPERDRFEEWADQYHPIKNHLNPDAPYDGTMFETYSPEIDFVKAAKPQHIWTWVSGDENQDILVAGYHFVNRNGYFITELPWIDSSESYEFGGGDPQNAGELANKMIEDELPGVEWWNNLPPETKLEKVRSVMSDYGMEELDPNEVIAAIDRQYRDLPLQ